MSEIFLYFLWFEEPYEAENVCKEYLEKYAAYAQEFTHNSVTVSTRRDYAHEISYLVGERTPFAERVLETRYTEINWESLRERLEQIDHVTRECRSDIANCEDEDSCEEYVEEGEEDFFLRDPEYGRWELFWTFCRQCMEVILCPFCCETKEIRTEKCCEKKYHEILNYKNDNDDTYDRGNPFSKGSSHDILLDEITHKK